MKTITVKYGIDQFQTEVEDSYTVGQLKEDARLQTALGYGDNVNVLIEGVAQNDSVVVPNLACLKVETAANKKGNQ